jgi:hypothetical protein
MNKNNSLMLDMGQKLIEDKSGIYRKQLLDQLSSASLKVQQEIAAGPTSLQFEGLNKLKIAIEQAKLIINTI